jgi:hypothetical protein
MALQTLKIEAVRNDEYRIYIDPDVWTNEAIKEWSNHFFEASGINDIARHLAFSILRFGVEDFIEGFGYVREVDKDGTTKQHFYTVNGRLDIIPDDKYCKGISVWLVSCDDEYEIDIIK